MWEALIPAALVLGLALLYNSLVKLRERAESAWADIDVQLRRRHDLIPNLVETVKGYAAHERRTLESVVEARSGAISAEGPAERGRAEADLGTALASVFALAERYPELRATESFRRLHDSLTELEDDLQNARRYYNAVVRDYNTRIGQVPSNVVARAFGFREKEFFEVSDGARATPTVELEEESG